MTYILIRLNVLIEKQQHIYYSSILPDIMNTNNPGMYFHYFSVFIYLNTNNLQ